MAEHINKLFMAVIVLSLFTYFERADYNLPLFVFILFLWNHPKPVTGDAMQSQKSRLWYLVLFSLLVDFIWIIYWALFWNREDFRINNPTRLTSMTLLISAINFVLKVPLG